MTTTTFFRAGWFILAATCTAFAAPDWPGFRGPDGSGIAPANVRPPTTWSETQNLKWKVDLPGPGSSSPIVAGPRIFVTCYTGYGTGGGGAPDQLKRHLIGIERDSGKILWDTAVAAVLPEDPYSGYLTEHGYASSTPVTDGERIYVFFGKTGVLAFDFDGHQLWQVDVGRRSSNRRWGSAASPVLHRDMVIVNAAEESRSVRALDRRTGREIWRTDGDSLELSFDTPALLDGEGGRGELALSLPGQLWGLEASTGKRIWTAQTGIEGNVTPSVVAADGVVYATGGYPRLSTVAVRSGGTGDVTKTHVSWTSQNASYVPSPVVHDGRLYIVSDAGIATCLDARTGSAIYKERLPGVSGRPFYASPILANGLLYAVSRRHGTYLIAAGPEFNLVAQNRIAGDDSDFNATPALADRQLFLRSNRALYCIEAAPLAAQP
jgi:outer membrane protein assembly factor BamB